LQVGLEELLGRVAGRFGRVYTHATPRMLEGAADVIDLAVRNARGSSSGSNDGAAKNKGQAPNGEDGVRPGFRVVSPGCGGDHRR
jgi:hypothetical protein